MDQPHTQSLTCGVRTQAAGFFQSYINWFPPGFEKRPILSARHVQIPAVGPFRGFRGECRAGRFSFQQYIAYRTTGTITVDGKQKAGNVWEICAGTMVIDAKERVVYRGGGWVSPPAQVHASVGVAGVTRCRYIGFRCARDAQ